MSNIFHYLNFLQSRPTIYIDTSNRDFEKSLVNKKNGYNHRSVKAQKLIMFNKLNVDYG